MSSNAGISSYDAKGASCGSGLRRFTELPPGHDGAQRHELQRWQRLRDRRAVAAGSGAAERAVAGTCWSPPASSATALGSAPAGQASSRRGFRRCLASCVGDVLEPSITSQCSGTSACEKDEQWQLAPGLLGELRRGRAGSQRHRLQRWNQQLRDRRAAARGAAQRASARRHQPQPWEQAPPARQASSGSGLWR